MGTPSVVYMAHNGIRANSPSVPTNPGKHAGSDLGSLADGAFDAAGTAPAQASQGDAGDGAASADGAGAAGDAGAGGGVFPRGSDKFLSELKAATGSQLKGRIGTNEQRQGLRERYLSEGTASFLAGGNGSDDTAAGKDLRLDVRKGNARKRVRPDSGRDTGNEGTPVRPPDYTRGLAKAAEELKGLQPIELQNLGLLSPAQAKEAQREHSQASKIAKG